MTARSLAITGASGAVGTALIPMAIARGFEIVALSRRRPEKLAPEVRWEPFDLDDTVGETAEKLQGIDTVIHLAAAIPGRSAAEGGDVAPWTGNVLGTQKLIGAMHAANVGRLVLAGAANLYAPDRDEAYEDSPFGPQSRILYLASKAAQEWLASSECRAKNIGCAIMRISSIVGDGKSILDQLAAKIAGGETVHVDGGAAFGADFVDCADVAAGLLLAVDEQLQGAFNLSSGVRTELIDALSELAKILGYPAETIKIAASARAADIGFPAVNCDRMRRYGFRPKPLAELLEAIAARVSKDGHI